MKFVLFIVLLFKLQADAQKISFNSEDIEAIASRYRSFYEKQLLFNKTLQIKDFKNLGQEFFKISRNHIADSVQVINFLISNIKRAEFFLKNNNYDSAFKYYLVCEPYIECCHLNYIESSLEFYRNLFKLFLNSDPEKSKIFLRKSLICGNSDFSDILEYCRYSNAIDIDTINLFFKLSNINYVNQEVAPEYPEFELLFRRIEFDDQFYRIQYYNYKTITIGELERNDSILEQLFSFIIQNPIAIRTNVLHLSSHQQYYQQSFHLLLLHSVNNKNRKFFENNFNLYSQLFQNNFRDITNLQLLLDSYLKGKFFKQYFQTELGMEFSKNKKMEMLPSMPKISVLEILNDLKVINPKL